MLINDADPGYSKWVSQSCNLIRNLFGSEVLGRLKEHKLIVRSYIALQHIENCTKLLGKTKGQCP